MKKAFATLALLSAALFFAPGCKKDSKSEPDNTVIGDAKGLSNSLNIDGAKRTPGAIPEPTSGSYGDDLNLLTQDITLSDANASFELQMEIDSSVVFFQVDGADDYFELVLDRNGNALAKGTDYTKQLQTMKGISCVAPCPNPPRFKQTTMSATVQTCRLRTGQTRQQCLTNRQNWCRPMKIKINTYPTAPSGTANGSFSFGGNSYSGPCVKTPSGSCSGGENAGIVGNSGNTTLLVYNIPAASGGSFAIKDGEDYTGTCELTVAVVDGASNVYVSTSGTLTKTAANKFTVSMSCKNLNSAATATVTGSGSY